MRARSVNDEEMEVPAKPSIGTVAATIATVGIVMGLWVSLTLVLNLIFHFHPIVLGLAAGWTQRREWVAPRDMLGRHCGSPFSRGQRRSRGRRSSIRPGGRLTLLRSPRR